MAHDLYIDANGNASMFYVKSEGLPWHTLGKGVDNALTSAEALVMSGQDWEVTKQPLTWFDKDGTAHTSKNMFAIIREDTQEVLNKVSVGSYYQPWQNREAFAFFDELVGDKLAMYHTAGVLGNGERVWILAKLPGELRVGREDLTEKYIVLTMAHDGSAAVRIFPTGVRVVCANTYLLALQRANATDIFSIRHTANIHQRIAEARKTLHIANEQFMRMEDVFKAMASHELTQAEVDSVVAELIPLPKPKEDGSEANPAYALAQRRAIAELMESSPGNDLPDIKGTAYALWNGVTDYVDHYRTVRSKTRDAASARLYSVWFGTGNRLKHNALRKISQLAGVNLDKVMSARI